MEFDRMANQLHGLVDRALKGKKTLRRMDVEAIRDALARLDEPYEEKSSKVIGFHRSSE